ncbi:SRA stem-loop-interacting RNA-binding protein, mitochondrial isoform X2 [Gorilla gorilla gorilla]|uniref:SRA stem-loop-interacting RNA-binding protein, mitochondrial isoform X2 n=1 Tax=Gorilla gorilla gorilla TaxID=9595 RepID=UPI002445F547|nr:SRA stem-loop-interacting RNA-binding protein, mitochondrial isoform X2 [Gorilla gorilla gorilla]
MAASAARGAAALRRSINQPVAFVRRIPWTAASSQLKEHFAQFGHVRRCILPFHNLNETNEDQFVIYRTRRLAFTEVWVGFSFLQKKDFGMHYNRKIIL